MELKEGGIVRPQAELGRGGTMQNVQRLYPSKLENTL